MYRKEVASLRSSLSLSFSYLLLFFGVFALSTSAIFVKLADAPATVSAFYRMLFATIVLLPFLLLSVKSRQELTRLTKKWGLGLSIISMGILGEVVGTCFLAYIILNEVISFKQGVGIFLILSGLAIFMVKQ
ncbi:EamA family transporter [Chengkuizengella axinellae]|uniref:EamA family transporter n=1 Tax=Chengkuizengella axinellae TaxID=3064388 RepID=UPI003F9F65F0